MNKYKRLLLSVFLDAIGYISYLIPGIGELFDIIWAPLSTWIMTKLYKGTSGKVAAVINFAEEALPGFDFIPTFTLMWIYTNILKKKNKYN